MRFTKMHGLGNDFIIFEDLSEDIDFSNEIISKLCDRRFGIGADGLMIVNQSKTADIRMRYYNTDGNQAEMCGNGIRCFAKYVYENAISLKNPVTIETLAGIKTIFLQVEDDKVVNVRVNMGRAKFKQSATQLGADGEEIILYENHKIQFSYVSMGNPHSVIIVEKLENYPVEEIGPFIENHPIFPNKTNVNFVEVINADKIKVVTWERGSGLTLACGTGACASAAVANSKGMAGNKIDVQLLGGNLLIELDDEIFMTGRAVKVFEGDINIDSLM